MEENFGSPLLIYNGTCIIVPPSARSRVLDLLHNPHAGQVKTEKADQQLYYWPGMNAAIHDRIAGCKVCTEALPSKLAPSHSTLKLPQWSPCRRWGWTCSQQEATTT